MRTLVSSSGLACALALLLTAAGSAQEITISLQPLHAQPVSHARQIGAMSTCSRPDSIASIDGAPYFEIPWIAQAQGATGTAGVAIELTASGALRSESILASSGNPNLDRAALLSARMTRFSPAVTSCQSAGGIYLYNVTF